MLSGCLLLLTMSAGIPFLVPIALTLTRALAEPASSVNFAVDPLAPSAALWGVAGSLLLIAPGPLRLRAEPLSFLLALAAFATVASVPGTAPLIPYLIGAACFYRARQYGSSNAFVLKYLRLAAAVATLVASYGILQAFWNRIVPGVSLVNPFGQRVLSTLGNPTFLADYLAISLPLALSLAASAIGVRAFSSWAASACAMLAAIVLSGSKGGQLSSGLVVAAWLVCAFLTRSMSRTRIVVLAITMVCGAAALTLSTSSFSYSFARWTATSDRFSFSQRLAIARGTASLIARSPILGNGTSSFPAVFPSVQPESLKRSLGISLSVNHAHNDYLEITSDLGILGLGLLLAIGVSVLLRFPVAHPPNGIAFSLLAGAICMGSNFLLFVPSSAFPLWVGAGLLCARPNSVTRDPSPKNTMISAFLVLLCVTIAAASVRNLLGTGWYDRGAASISSSAPGEAARTLSRAAALLPSNRHVWQNLGRAHEMRSDHAAAVHAFSRARLLGPNHAITHLNVGRAEREWFKATGNSMHRDRAILALTRSIRENPFQVQAREWGAELSLDARRLDAAAVFLEGPPEGLAVTPTWFWLKAKWLNAAGHRRDAVRAMREGDILAAQVEIARAEDILRAGNAAEAERIARRLAERSPELPVTWEALGYILSTRGKGRDARDCFSRMAAISPNSLSAHLNVAIISLNLDDRVSARSAIARAARLAPDHVEVRLTRARLGVREGDYAAAEKDYRWILTQEPEHSQAKSELRDLQRR